jgi:glycosyltransferase involved in cell wall biosynthesis
VTEAAVVIPALNEADNIGALLEDCAAQTRAPAQVVVVDAGSVDGTPEIVRERTRGWPALELAVRRGALPGAARNAGIARANAPVIATLDAGSRVGPHWLEALTAAVDGADDRLAVGRSVPDARSEFERAAGWFTLGAFKPPDGPGPVGREFLPAGRNGYCFTRATWERAGGYPDDLPWGEDKMFLRRARDAGAEVMVVPDAVVRWRPRRSLAEFYRQYARYGRGDARARIDRQNELVPLALYSFGATLALLGARGSRPARLGLAAGALGYLGLFTAAARRELSSPRALAWVPALRVTADVAKMHGFLAEALTRSNAQPSDTEGARSSAIRRA